MKSQSSLNLAPFIEHYGDSLLPYIPTNRDDNTKERRDKKTSTLLIIVKSKLRYVEVRSLLNTRMLWNRQTAFPDSTLRRPR
ncbi:hypothetical protein ALC57_08175 [Trachymyrmex cornetzi]|uniref:Uncharacterized protein n=1 Tax=Trachymyrmex cornetzi TaxID=471704 RepID=A0A151J795_9HYME|nr:hypothetical protein ALC57_08175 [Trachymyrmex cornetzi]